MNTMFRRQRETLPVFAGLLLAFAMATANAAPTVNLTASPTSGISPVNVTLTWSSTGAASCSAGGGWSGTKALSGTETLSGVTVSTTYTLTCVTSSGSATVSWTAPTQNTDNTPIAATGPGSLAGFKLYHAPTASGVAGATPIVINDKAATSYVISGLPVGTRYYGVKAFNVEGIESALSSLANNTIVLPSGSASAEVTVSVQPKPPVIVTVQQVVYDLRDSRNGPVLWRSVGTIPLGTPCTGEAVLQSWGTTYYQVPLDQVTLNKSAKSEVLVAACELTS